MNATDYIKGHQIFSVGEILPFFKTKQGAYSYLSRAARLGKVRRIKQGLYASNSGRFENKNADPHIIAMRLGDGASLCFKSAFEVFLGTQEPSRDVYVYSHERPSVFSFDDYDYHMISYPKAEPLTTTRNLFDGVSVKHTTKEQTIVDCLRVPGRCGGAEGVLRRLSAVLFVDVDLLVGLAAGNGPSVSAKTGWVLSRKRSDWNVGSEHIEALRNVISTGPYYFTTKATAVDFDASWKLYLPDNTNNMEDWLNG